jgi:hypothetical protein
MIRRLPNIDPLLDTRLQTILNELFTFVRHTVLLIRRKIHLRCFQHNSFIQHPQLTHLVSKRLLPEQHLVVYHADRPNIDFGSDHCLFGCLKTFGRQIPISPNSLRRQLNHVLFSCLAQPKVCYLYLALVEHDVLRFQVVVDYLVRE